MSIADGKGYILEEAEVLDNCFGNLEGIKNNVFASFLLGTTMQDGGKKKRSDIFDTSIHLYLNFILS